MTDRDAVAINDQIPTKDGNDAFYVNYVLPYTKTQFIRRIRDGLYHVKPLIKLLMYQNDVNRFSDVMDHSMILAFEALRFQLFFIIIKYKYYVFFKILLQHYITSNDITYDIRYEISISRDPYFIHEIYKFGVNNDEWLSMIRCIMQYEWSYRLKTSDELIISMFKCYSKSTRSDLNVLPYIRYTSINVLKYLENIIQIDWSHILIVNPYQEVKLYAMSKLENKTFKIFDESTNNEHMATFLFNSINEGYYVHIVNEDRIMTIKQYIQFYAPLRMAFRERKKRQYGIAYKINNLMFDVKDYDINITTIICDYLVDIMVV